MACSPPDAAQLRANVPRALVVEIDGKDNQFSQQRGDPTNEGSFVVWRLGQPGGATSFLRCDFLGSGR